MSETQHPRSQDQAPSQQIEDANGNAADETDTEFRLTIKKLELPVRPRGVLAE